MSIPLPPIHIAYLPSGAINRPGLRVVPRMITIHETANPNPAATAKMHRDYVHNGGGPERTSYNFVVDDHEAYALVPIGESGNHAGTPDGNHSGIAMELCINAGSDWTATKRNAAAICAHLYATVPTLLPFDESFGYHGRWRQTACPARLRSGEWAGFVAQVKAALAAGEGDPLDRALEAEYQARPWLRYQRHAARLTRDFPDLPGGAHFEGKVLLCGTQVLGVRDTGEVVDLMERVLDDWREQQIASGTLVLLGTPEP